LPGPPSLPLLPAIADFAGAGLEASVLDATTLASSAFDRG
jgi:hypothetical protein